MSDRYHALPVPPATITPGGIIGRMLAGMGFRFYWATDGLTQDIYAFRSAESARTLGEIVGHIWDTLLWVHRSFDPSDRPKPTGAPALREDSLELIGILEDSFSKLDEQALAEIQISGRPFWLMLNGPLADALTHIGQIATLRRMAGSPAPASNPFRGIPPTGR